MHCAGGGIGSWYSALFPEQVEKLVSIDLISFGSMALKKHVAGSRRSVLQAVKIAEKMAHGSLPVYTFEDACGRAFMASNILNGLGSISKVFKIKKLFEKILNFKIKEAINKLIVSYKNMKNYVVFYWFRRRLRS